jgi:hypothetical protein
MTITDAPADAALHVARRMIRDQLRAGTLRGSMPRSPDRA